MRGASRSPEEASTFIDLLPSAQEEVSRCVVELVRSEPFYGHVLGGIQRHFTSAIDTLAVGLRGDAVQLMVNPTFFLQELKRPEARTAVLKHEVLHIVFKHIFRIRSLDHDPFLWNIAADLVVNQYVSPYKLPDGAIYLATFPDLMLEAEDTADKYYASLCKLKRDVLRRGRSHGSPVSGRALKEILSENFPSDHTYWAGSHSLEMDGEITGASVAAVVRDALEQVMEDQILKAYERVIASKVPGVIPGWLERYIKSILECRKPQINWRRVIRMFSSSARRSHLVSTMQRESRRFQAEDDFLTYPGLKLKRFQKMVVALDTSGSIDHNTLETFFSEIHGIYTQGADITIVECDSDIKRVYRYMGRVPEYVKGGGGTSFEPIMQWLRSCGTRYDGCIYLTDGFADAPESKPPCKLLWVVSGGEGGDHLKFGLQVVLKPDGL